MPRGIGDAIARAAAADPGDPGTEHGAWEAVVSSVGGDGLVVTLPGYHPERDYGPCPYIAPGGTPQPGDAAIAVFNDQDRDPLVIVPGTPAIAEAPRSVGGAGEPAFQNGWVNAGATFNGAQFRKLADGRVELRGAIKSGTNNATAFTLPAGYRPPKDVIGVMTGFAASDTFTRIRVTAAGDVQIFMAATPTAEAHIGPFAFSLD